MTRNSAINSETALRELSSAPNRRETQAILDRLAISADAKSILISLADMTIQIGNAVVAIGRKIIAVAVALMRTFPNVIFGVIIALVLSMLITAVPLIGAPIATILGPLLLVMGLASGTLNEMRDGQLGARVNEFVNVVETAFIAR